MKKKFILILFAINFSMAVHAQLSVTNTGQIQIGTINSTSNADAGSALIIWPHTTGVTINADNHMSFGSGSNNTVGTIGKVFTIRAVNGIQVYSNTSSMLNRIFYYAPSGNLFTFGVDVKAPSFLTSSDVRLKSNIVTLEDYYTKLEDLNPVSYTYAPIESDDLILDEESKNTLTTQTEAAKAEANRTHFGFIAQEVREIFPNLVVEDEDGMLSIDYNGFIPLLVDAVRNLTAKVKEQQIIIDELINMDSPSRKRASTTELEMESITMSQNKPNPFNSVTTISCSLPQSVREAFICIL